MSEPGGRKPGRGLLAALALAAGAGWLAAGGGAAAEAVRIVAVVNDEAITDADVAAYLSALLAEGAAPTEGADRAEVRRAVLRRLIEQRLMLQEAKRSGVAADGEEVLRRLEDVRRRFPSDEAFERSLAEAGLSKEHLKAQLRDQLLVERLVDRQVRATVVVSPQEVAAAGNPSEPAREGERVRVSHLLVRAGEQRTEAEARALIEDLRRRLRDGADFAELARRYSEDPHGPDGGDMGWVVRGELLPELEAALNGLQPGVISEPVQTKLGFHLLAVTERQAASATPEDRDRNIRQQLYQQKFHDAFQRWLDDLMRRAYIEVEDDRQG